MVELNTMLVVGLIGFGIGIVTALVLGSLFVLVRNVQWITEKVKEDTQEQNEQFAIPLSSLGYGGGNTYTMSDLMRAAALAAAKSKGSGDEKETKANDGMYL